MTPATIELCMLGPLEARVDGTPVPLGGPKQRALLALLLLHENDVVPLDVLIEELWETPPRTAPAFVQNCVWRLRKVLPAETLETRPPGYRLHIEPETVDARRFERLVREARGLPARERAESLREALALWRGTPLSDLAYWSFAQDPIRNLEEQRINALQMRIEAELELGLHREAIGELDALVREHPSHERLRWLQLLALHRSDRRQDALAAYQEARLAIVEESGMEPGEELRALQRRILQDDPTLKPDGVAAEVAEPPAQLARKVVAVCIVELLVDDELDVEAARGLVSRGLAALEEIVLRHGGRVEQLLGEEALAVFGLPAAHEDDGLRAIRAVSELRDAVTGAELRAAVAIGEVLVGDGTSLSGAAITVARRAKEAAEPGEILLGPAVARLVLDAARIQPSADGSWARLVEVVAGAATPARRPDAPLVGREAELERLVLTTREAASSASCRRIVVIGEPGVGKTRLAAELVRAIGCEARVLTGRCVPYGDGATYLPLAGVVDQVVGGKELGPALQAVLGDAEEGDVAASRLTQAIEGSTAVASGDVFWAARKLLETLARETPLVVVLEDVHWAESTFLDLVEYVVGWSKGAGITIVCLARTELLDDRPSWAADALVLRPLGADDAELLLESLPESGALETESRASVVSVAEGNPLFLEQLAAHAVEAPLAPGEVPSSLDSLLASRLDALEPGEKAAHQRAAIVGREFTRAAVDALTPEGAKESTGTELMALVRRRLVRPDDRETGEDGFLFEHALVRDAAYASITKADRARLHEKLARWLDECGERDEIIGYHLEQAVANRHATGDVTTDLAGEAGVRLARAGERAAWSMDHSAAIGLLERAAVLLDEADARRFRAECILGFALKLTGAPQKAIALLRETARRADAAGDRKHASWAETEEVWLQLAEGVVVSQQLAAITDEAVRLGSTDDDMLVVARAQDAKSLHEFRVGRFVAGLAETRAAAEAYEQYGLRGFKDPTLAVHAVEGPQRLEDVIEFCETRLAADAPRWREGYLLVARAEAEAHRGDFELATASLAVARARLLESGQDIVIPTMWAYVAGTKFLLAGDAAEAEEVLLPALDDARTRGHRDWEVHFSALCSEASALEGDMEAALRLASKAQTLAVDPDHLWGSFAWRSALARARLMKGDVDEAQKELRIEIERWESTGALIVQGRLRLLLAEALAAAGRREQAASVAEESARLLEQKGATHLEGVARTLVARMASGGA